LQGFRITARCHNPEDHDMDIFPSTESSRYFPRFFFNKLCSDNEIDYFMSVLRLYISVDRRVLSATVAPHSIRCIIQTVAKQRNSVPFWLHDASYGLHHTGTQGRRPLNERIIRGCIRKFPD